METEFFLMAEHSNHQQRIIKNYYQNRDAISLQKLQEAVTELFLAEGKKRQRHWDRIAGHLEKLGVHASRIEHLRKTDDPALVAELVRQLTNQ
jgi:hypothetical protein